MADEMRLLIAKFDNEQGAKEALKAIEEAQVERGDAAVLTKNEQGEINVKEAHSWGWGILTGAVAGGLIGLFVPVVGVIVGAGTGAALGAVVDKLRDAGFPDERLKTMAESLEPGDSMIIILLDSGSASAAERITAESGGELIGHSLDADLVEAVGEGGLIKAIENALKDLQSAEERYEAAEESFKIAEGKLKTVEQSYEELKKKKATIVTGSTTPGSTAWRKHPDGENNYEHVHLKVDLSNYAFSTTPTYLINIVAPADSRLHDKDYWINLLKSDKNGFELALFGRRSPDGLNRHKVYVRWAAIFGPNK